MIFFHKKAASKKMKLSAFLNAEGGSLPLAPTGKAVFRYPLCGEASPQRPSVYCLTGKMAAGKNYVASKIEEKLGFASIDLDKTVHTAISLCTEQIFSTFEGEAKKAGIDLRNADGSLNRRALGALIFPKPELLKKQEEIVYPKVIELTYNYIEENRSKNKSVLINATVLFKTPELLELCDKVLFVTANPVKRFLRARRRDKIPAKQILQRFRAQKNLLDEYKKSGREILIITN